MTNPTTKPSAEYAAPRPPAATSQSPTAQWQLLPQLPSRAINKVVHFSESEGILTVDWPMLDSGPMDGRFSLTDLPGEARIQCLVGHRVPVIASPMFEYYDISSDGVCKHLQVLNPQMNLQVVQDYESESPPKFESVSLIENMNEPEPVTLRVQMMENGQQSVGEAYTAKNLSELRQRYPAAFEKYLRPMFRQFHQEGTVFAVEDKIAWQVMAGDWQPQAGLAQKVDALIQQLDAPDYSTRQQAQESLHEMGEHAAQLLHSYRDRPWSAEQSARVHKFMAEYFVLTDAQAKKLGSDVDFLLDCLVSDDVELQAATVRHLEHVLGRPIEYKLNLPLSDRLAAVEKLRRQLTISATTREAAK